MLVRFGPELGCWQNVNLNDHHQVLMLLRLRHGQNLSTSNNGALISLKTDFKWSRSIPEGLTTANFAIVKPCYVTILRHVNEIIKLWPNSNGNKFKSKWGLIVQDLCKKRIISGSWIEFELDLMMPKSAEILVWWWNVTWAYVPKWNVQGCFIGLKRELFTPTISLLFTLICSQVPAGWHMLQADSAEGVGNRGPALLLANWRIAPGVRGCVYRLDLSPDSAIIKIIGRCPARRVEPAPR